MDHISYADLHSMCQGRAMTPQRPDAGEVDLEAYVAVIIEDTRDAPPHARTRPGFAGAGS